MIKRWVYHNKNPLYKHIIELAYKRLQRPQDMPLRPDDFRYLLDFCSHPPSILSRAHTYIYIQNTYVVSVHFDWSVCT